MTFRITRDALASGAALDFIREEIGSSPECGHVLLSEAELARSMDAALAPWDRRSDLWLFGYGSLIWNPAFHHAERRIALLRGWQRSFCLWMRIGRGSVSQPGLMLAIDEERGATCRGVAFRIRAAEVLDELPLIWVREMATGAYDARWLPVETATGTVQALSFVADRGHPLYAGHMPDAFASALIADAFGRGGSCAEYLFSTADHLREIGLPDPHLDALAARVRALRG
ncbi:gamma-glutamylcyclotransferase [Arenibaculum pallidiluteum]|uniref:gamma-glutamylcyclotransferase n=1 Tax=Arenibaculum pallidiluteum TaxID=2812559 RepID=UPI001A960095|nr:gamma-glutamylcyclotransferase [Arenibaculum pallidiluteum]